MIGLYKTKCVKIDGPFRTVDELELATLSWVRWFNEHRLHSSIGYAPPLEYETASTVRPNPGSSRGRENWPTDGRDAGSAASEQADRRAHRRRRRRGCCCRWTSATTGGSTRR